MTGDVVNLNKARKDKAKRHAQTGAKTNRLKFGRGKAETIAQKLEAMRARRTLDGHKTTRDDPDKR
jgi:hypothetical protein